MDFGLQMEAFSPNKSGGGLWNSARSIPYSKERQRMLALMKEESVLTNLRKTHTDRDEKTSSQTSNPGKNPHLSRSANKKKALGSKKRSAESCQSGSNYEREKFYPRLSRNFEEEKRRLQNMMQTGKDETTFAAPEKTPPCSDAVVSEDVDPRYEVLNEIAERRQFLAEMTALGQEGKYINIINTQIAQKLRELDILDQASSKNQGCESKDQK